MKNLRIKLFIIATFLAGSIFIMGGCNPNNSLTENNMSEKMTLNQAIEISENELQQKGYKIEDMRLEADDTNSLWEKFSTAPGTTTLQSPRVVKMDLTQRQYWAIHFAPQKQQLGGDAWVFIDKNSGEVIGTLFGR